jgi:hypothetical protein
MVLTEDALSWGGHRGRRSRVELLDFTLTGEATMTEDRVPLNELLQKAGDGDFLRADSRERPAIADGGRR